jgi:hypothetical protein
MDCGARRSQDHRSKGSRLHQHPNTIRKLEKPRGLGLEHGSNGFSETNLPPVRARGATAALSRLELTEERAYARLLQAIEDDDPFRIKAAQEFYLKSSETLRRLKPNGGPRLRWCQKSRQRMSRDRSANGCG